MRGLVIKNTGSWYLVKTDDGRYVECKIKGNFRLKGIKSTNPVVVGDYVQIVDNNDNAAFITEIEDRKNYIVRRASNLSKQSHIFIMMWHSDIISISIMESLGVSIKEISIKDACIQHFNDIEHDINQHDVTYENSQARERTQSLMDYANKIGGLVIGTGDLSELALGWATYNGDHMSMYGVNASIPKTLVKYLVNWVAMNIVDEKSKTTLLDIVDTPISPELIPADENGNIKQKTEDLVGPYELHDFFLYNIIRFGFTPAKVFFLANIAFEGEYDRETIKKWLTTFYRRFFQQQFKRSCLPDGPKVGSVSLSPRGDWRMPSDASATLWLNECSKL